MRTRFFTEKLGWLFLTLGLAGSEPLADTGYLVGVGPTALRFRKSAPRPELPPLWSGEEPSPGTNSEAAPAATETEKNSAKEAQNDTTATGPVPEVIPDASAIEFIPPTEESTPAGKAATPTVQKESAPEIMQYFRVSTNSGTYITVPVPFNPPGAPVVPPSTATYISQ